MSTQEAFRLVGVVEARTRGAEADLRRFDRTAQNSARNLQATMGSSERSFLTAGRAASSFLERFGHISNIIQGIPQIGALAGALTRPLFQAAEAGIKLNMTLEQAQIAYEGVAGSQEKALKFLKDLQRFGQRSPFRFEGLLEASRFMTAMGFALDEQIPKLTIWGNAIASSGELSAEKIHDVVRAMGQMRMAGRVNAQDMNQLINANIPGWELLAKAIGKTVAETRKLSEAGRLDGAKAVEAITTMMEIDPRFKNMMARLEKTTAGRLSAAEDVLQFAQATATKSLTGDISKTLEASLKRADLADSLAGKIDSAIKPISGALTGVITATLEGDADGLKNVAKDVLGSALSSGLTDGISEGIGSVKSAIGSLVTDGVVNPFKQLLGIRSPSQVFNGFGHRAAEGFTEGFAEGLNDGTFDTIIERFLGRIEGKLSTTKKRSAENLAKLMQREPDFKPKLIRESQRRGINPDHLLNVMAVETAGSFNPAIKNPNSTASGLIQFMAETARNLGTTTEALRKMSATQQLDYVFKYFDDFLKRGYNLSTQGAVYAAVGAGKVGRSDNSVLMTSRDRGYAGNAATWDPNRDGVVRQGEMASAALSKLGAGVNFTVNGSSSVSSSNPMPVIVVAVAGGMQKLITGTESRLRDGDYQGALDFITGSVKRGGQRITGTEQTIDPETLKLLNKMLLQYGQQLTQARSEVSIDVGGYAFRRTGADRVKAITDSQLLTTTSVMATSITPRATQALEQMADNTERMVKGAGEWKDVIVESEEASRRLKVHWTGIAQSFESAFLTATGQALQGNFGDALRGFFLDMSFDVAQQVNSALSARLSKSLFDFQGSDSEAGGGLVSKFLNKIGLGSTLEKLGLQTPRRMTGQELLAKMREQPLTTNSNVMATSLSSASGGSLQATLDNKRKRGTMPESKGNADKAPESGVSTGEVRQAVETATDKINSAQQAQTAQLNATMNSNTDRLVDAVTPRQQGFWSGLLGTVLSAAAGAAAGAAVNGALGGDGGGAQKPNEGPQQPRPTTPPVLQFPNGRTTPARATGGIIEGPGTETSDSILGVDRRGMPTALVSQGEFVVNAASTRKNRPALEFINKTGKLPKFGLGGFLKWTSPISHQSVRDVTMPISHEGFRNVTMPITNQSFRNATMPATYLGGGSNTPSRPAPGTTQGERASLRTITQTNGEVHKHYHFNVHAHGSDAAQSIKKSKRQLARQARETFAAA